MAARLISAQPLMGLGWELNAITGAVIGGTILFGGIGSVLGVVLGIVIVEIISNGMNLLSILKYTQQIIIGAILIFALVVLKFKRGNE